MRLGLAFMLGGAVGNLIDRVSSGEVVDFIKFPHWPAFNVADSSITIGVMLLLWAMTREPATVQNTAS
jgi:signal peptidase II